MFESSVAPSILFATEQAGDEGGFWEVSAWIIKSHQTQKPLMYSYHTKKVSL